MVGGVLSGLADYAEVSPYILRIGWIVLILFFNVAAILTYFALMFSLPKRQGQKVT